MDFTLPSSEISSASSSLVKVLAACRAILGWAAQLELDPDLRHAVHVLALDPTIPQPTRHRAKRLYYTGKV
jgi:hypothetical protein